MIRFYVRRIVTVCHDLASRASLHPLSDRHSEEFDLQGYDFVGDAAMCSKRQ